MLNELQVVQIFHIPREANMAAHTIAKVVAQEFGCQNWLGNGPSWLVNALESDKPVTRDFSREVSCGDFVHNHSIPSI